MLLYIWLGGTYTEVLQVINGELVSEQVEQSILQHAAVAVTIQFEISRDPKNTVIDVSGGKNQPNLK